MKYCFVSCTDCEEEVETDTQDAQKIGKKTDVSSTCHMGRKPPRKATPALLKNDQQAQI